jgi:hypothetical protein
MCSATNSSTTSTTTASRKAIPTYYIIEPKLSVSYEVLSSFTNRLKAENDPSKLAVTEDAEDEFLAY